MILAASVSSLRQSTASRRCVKLSRASMTPGNLFKPFSIFRMQPAQFTPSTASVIYEAPALPGSTNSDRSKVSAIAMDCLLRGLFQDDAVLGTEQPFALPRQLDEQVPLAGGKLGVADEMARPGLTHRNGMVEPPIGRPRELGVRRHTADRSARSVLCDDVEACRAVGRAGELCVDLPVLR